jgi:hypothetical protein
VVCRVPSVTVLKRYTSEKERCFILSGSFEAV